MIEYEIAPEEYWQELTLNDAMLYCFSLNIDGKIGWRFPTVHECCFLYANNPNRNAGLWNCEDVNFRKSKWEPDITFLLIPVRDIL